MNPRKTHPPVLPFNELAAKVGVDPNVLKGYFGQDDTRPQPTLKRHHEHYYVVAEFMKWWRNRK